MPGIVGIISQGNSKKLTHDLKVMVSAMTQEPFYAQRYFVDESLGVYLGWSWHKESFADCMPAMSENSDIVLLFAGEHFPARASEKSHNAGELIKQYERDGEQVFRDLNGWFSGVLIDRRNAKTFLFNDRYGMQRVYYHERQGEFLFGSEAKALLKVRPYLRQIDSRGLGELVSCNCVLDNRTLFPGIFVLPGGAVWKWSQSGGPEKHSYFTVGEWEQLAPLKTDEFIPLLKETMLEVIPRYFREKGKIGISITGGLDSRMIMACLNARPGELQCYTFGGAREMLDITIARRVAAICRQAYSVIRFGKNFFSDFPRLAERTIAIADGNSDVLSTHDLYFNELAREIAPIRVTGKFGSEVIRDHTMFNAGSYDRSPFQREISTHITNAVHTLSFLKKGHPLTVAVFKDFPWREYNKIAIEQSQSIFRSPYLDNDLVKLMYRVPPGLRASNEPQRRIIRECNAALAGMLTDRGYGEKANSLFAHLRELFYYAVFKADYIYVSALPHWCTALDTMVLSVNGQRPLFGLQKFEYYRIWFRNELSSYIKEILLDPKTLSRPCFERKTLEMMVRTHMRGTRNYMHEINKALSLELTYRVLIDG